MKDATRSDTRVVAGRPMQTGQRQLIAFMALSAGCMTAGIAAGIYAFMLSRRQMAGDALTDVHDLLETCRKRVSHMEAELNALATVLPGEAFA